MAGRMKKEACLRELKSILKDPARTGVRLASMTSYHIGGPADVVACPRDAGELFQLLKFVRRAGLRSFVMGNGTNVVPSDRGFRGVIISMKKLNRVTRAGTDLGCGAGYDLDALVRYSIRHGLSGMANLSGIPGTVGGGLRMNAGAFGSEISDNLIDVLVMDHAGRSKRLSRERIGFGYRQAKRLSRQIVLHARFRLKRGSKAGLRRVRERVLAQRRGKQPWQYYSAGSVFKRPPGHYAGSLIARAGLCGHRVGGAEVSAKHAGFIINKGKATATDIRTLIRLVQDRVYKKFKVKLKLEQILLT